MRTKNLKLRTDLLDWVRDGWSVTQQMIVYKNKLLKKSSNWKSKLVLSTRLPPTRKPVLCLCSPVRLAQAVPERCPKNLAIDFAFKSFDCLQDQIREWLPDDRHWSAGAWTWTLTWTLPPHQRVVEVLSALKPQKKFNKLCGVWNLFRTPNLRTAVSHYLRTALRPYQPSPPEPS